MVNAEILVAEIGSTTTVVTAFTGLQAGQPSVIGQGQAPTTVADGDVTLGLAAALAALENSIGGKLGWQEIMAASSAAGGLRMTVHGLVYDMTVKAAREAALGAGANIHWVTAGELSGDDLERIEAIEPNILLLAGGVDYGEKATVIANARHLGGISIRPPVIYAGNAAAGPVVRDILARAGFEVTLVDNVYPRIDRLEVEPTRRAIHAVFERHIVEAPGMHKIRDMIGGRIIPTPGAVMRAAQLLREQIGDLVVLDVGGATTDVHSVAERNPQLEGLEVTPEPLAKRTVEGDLGIYINAPNVIKLCAETEVQQVLGCPAATALDYCVPVPAKEEERRLAAYLAETAARTALRRHAGVLETLYGPTGRIFVLRGKDLTGVKWIIGTGGALTKLDQGAAILARLNGNRQDTALAPQQAEVLIDRHYIMAAAGLLAEKYPGAALELLKASLG